MISVQPQPFSYQADTTKPVHPRAWQLYKTASVPTPQQTTCAHRRQSDRLRAILVLLHSSVICYQTVWETLRPTGVSLSQVSYDRGALFNAGERLTLVTDVLLSSVSSHTFCVDILTTASHQNYGQPLRFRYTSAPCTVVAGVPSCLNITAAAKKLACDSTGGVRPQAMWFLLCGIGVGDRGQERGTCPKKIGENIFSGKSHNKFGHFRANLT